MNITIHKILCWVIALSLAGFPVISVSADLYAKSSTESCHEISSDTKSDAALEGLIDENGNCCNDACQCPAMAVCHSNSYSQVALIADLFSSHKCSVIDQALSVYINSYHSHNIPPDIQPPIV